MIRVLAAALVVVLAYSVFVTAKWVSISEENVRLQAISGNAEIHSEAMALLKSHIRSDYPAIRSVALSDWGKVKILREWTHEHVDWGSPSAALSPELDKTLFDSEAPAIFAIFFQDKGAVQCEETAHALMKLYQAYGYDAYTVGVGIPSVMTHAATLVRINYEGVGILVLEDATFDIEYVDSDGNPYDYFDLLRALKDKRDITIERGACVPNDYLFLSTEEIGDVNWRVAGDIAVPAISADKRKCRFGQNFDNWWEIHGDAVSTALQGQGLPPDFVYLYLDLLYIRGGDNAGELLDRATSIIGG